MKFTVSQWKLIDLYKLRGAINFPVYQRGEVWFEPKKALLIDSIFKGLDIPKVYLQRIDGEWDCIDGQQRIRTIWSFYEDEFEVDGEKYSDLDESKQRQFDNYLITVAEIEEITDDEVRLLFTRLQLGLPLNSGEKLNAIRSNLGDFVKTMKDTPFIQNVNIPKRRFAREQVCAQICNNSKYINRNREFKNSKYEDLELLYRTLNDFDLKSENANDVLSVLGELDEIFDKDAFEIRSRAMIVTIYLYVEDLYSENKLDVPLKLIFKEFVIEFLSCIKEQLSLGLDATNRFILNFQSKVIQGADTKSSITSRHELFSEAFEYYKEHNSIKGN